MSRRPRLLLLAYACSPVKGSEPALGWNRALDAAKYRDTWVICGDGENGDDIRAYLANHDIPGLEFVFVPRTPFVERLRRTPGLYYLAYNLWHRAAFEVAQRLHRDTPFDIAHQVNFCGFREPGYLWRLDVPFVWGPIGGTHLYPWRFLGEAGVRGAVIETARTIATWLQLRFSPRVRRAARRAAPLLATSSGTRAQFARYHGIDSVVIPANGIAAVSGATRELWRNGPLRLIWSGVLDQARGLPLLLKALAQLPPEIPYELRIVGDGPDRARSQALAGRLGLEGITWLGRIPYDQMQEQYAWGDVFVFTGLRDTLATVLLEALAAGLPVVTLDHQGAADVITDACGVKIRVIRPRQVAADMATAIEGLARNAKRRRQLSRAAVDRASAYLWSHQGQTIGALYPDVLQPAGGAEAGAR